MEDRLCLVKSMLSASAEIEDYEEYRSRLLLAAEFLDDVRLPLTEFPAALLLASEECREHFCDLLHGVGDELDPPQPEVPVVESLMEDSGYSTEIAPTTDDGVTHSHVSWQKKGRRERPRSKPQTSLTQQSYGRAFRLLAEQWANHQWRQDATKDAKFIDAILILLRTLVDAVEALNSAKK